MTAIIISSFLIGAVASRRLLRWGQNKSASLIDIEFRLTAKAFLPLQVAIPALLAVIYPIAYFGAMLLLAVILAIVAAAITDDMQSERRGFFSSILTRTKESDEAQDRTKRRIAAAHGFMFVLLIGTLATEALLSQTQKDGFLYPQPETHAFMAGKRAAPTLLEAVKDEDEELSLRAAVMLIKMGEEESLIRLGATAVPALINALGYEEENWFGDWFVAYT
jgi:hypothetical protein